MKKYVTPEISMLNFTTEGIMDMVSVSGGTNEDFAKASFDGLDFSVRM